MIFDSHVHTVLSVDADTTIDGAIRAAAGRGVGLVLTDHMDWDFPAPFPDFRVDLEAFFREYAPLRHEGLLLGIELGVTARSVDRCNEIAASRNFDFVLGSVHVLDGEEVGSEMYCVQSEDDLLRRYLLEAAAMVRAVDMDALAHVDYPLRSASRELPYADFAREYAVLFAALRERGVCLELNTSRLGSDAAYRNLREVYRAYRAAGGQYVTLGSDAHDPREIAEHFDRAAALLKETGLIPVHFAKRKMIIDDAEGEEIHA